MRPRFICLTNIPSPYRIHLFTAFSQALNDKGWEFEVWFMADSEPGRHWDYDDSPFPFRSRKFRGLHYGTYHFNPEIIRSLIQAPPQVLLVGGGWANPTVLFLRPYFRKKASIFWCESHEESARKPSGWIHRIRVGTFRAFEAFASPGRLSEKWIQSIAPGKTVFKLPNTVNESIFLDRVDRLRAQRSSLRCGFNLLPDKWVLLIPARLMPRKGILPFLRAVELWNGVKRESVAIVIAGDGPLRSVLEERIQAQPLCGVRLLGHVDESTMAKLYALSDGLALPSYIDPNPLSVIEALWAGLPLLLSDKVGNWPEALRQGENGWVYNVDNPSSVQAAIENWVAALEHKGERIRRTSRQVARDCFYTPTVVADFIEGLLRHFQLEGLGKSRPSPQPGKEFVGVRCHG
jgi:glycosyltransferase involved in cell wall biosynthesis